MGHERTSRYVRVMSAFPLKADIHHRGSMSALCQKRTCVINGIVAVPIMAVMMLIVTNHKAMGRFQARPMLAWAGWGATALMGVTVVALLWSLLP